MIPIPLWTHLSYRTAHHYLAVLIHILHQPHILLWPYSCSLYKNRGYSFSLHLLLSSIYSFFKIKYWSTNLDHQTSNTKPFPQFLISQSSLVSSQKTLRARSTSPQTIWGINISHTDAVFPLRSKYCCLIVILKIKAKCHTHTILIMLVFPARLSTLALKHLHKE